MHRKLCLQNLWRWVAQFLMVGRGVHAFLEPGTRGSRRLEDKSLALHRLAHSGIMLVNSAMVAFEWLGAASHPQFKSLQMLIKEQPVQ